MYAVALVLPAAILALFDARIQRIAAEGFRAFATGVLALFLPVLLAIAALLAFGGVFFLLRKLSAVPESGTAVELYDERKGRL